MSVQVRPAPGAGGDFEGSELVVAPLLVQHALAMSPYIYQLVEDVGLAVVQDTADILDLLLFIVSNKGRELSITGRHISAPFARALMGALRLNSTMETLLFSDCQLSEESCLEIVSYVFLFSFFFFLVFFCRLFQHDDAPKLFED
jgi:hypothetical protein